MNTTKRYYEVLYIVDPTLTEEQVEPIIAKYSQLITGQDSEVLAAGVWDKRRLTYEVKGHREGIYILMYFVAESAVSKELDRVMRISEDVMRHIITRTEPQYIDTARLLQKPAEETVEQPAAEAEEAAPEEVTAKASEEAPAEEAAPAEEPAAEEKTEAVEETAPESKE